MHAFALLASALPALVSAHGHVTQVIADGVTYQGWDAKFKYSNPIPATVGWQADNLDNGFVSPDSFGTVNIVCHKSAKSGGASVAVKPGSKVTFVWDTWPDTHKGPIIDYIASCGTSCDTVSAASLQWVKIDQAAWKSGNDPGTWATDDLVAAKNQWSITFPNVAPGKYIIRHEIIALHAASSANGAQAYPQCVNFEVTGSGTKTISGGVAATSFYTSTDPGILFNLNSKFTGYTIPGPSLTTLKKREEREHARDFA